MSQIDPDDEEQIPRCRGPAADQSGDLHSSKDRNQLGDNEPNCNPDDDQDCDRGYNISNQFDGIHRRAKLRIINNCLGKMSGGECSEEEIDH